MNIANNTLLDDTVFVLEQTTEVLKPKVSKKCSVKNKTSTKRCSLTVDFVEEQTGDKYKNCDNYKKTKRSY